MTSCNGHNGPCAQGIQQQSICLSNKQERPDGPQHACHMYQPAQQLSDSYWDNIKMVM